MAQAELEPVQVAAPVTEADRSILTPEAVRFLRDLSRNFEPRRQELLARRRERQQEIDRGQMPQFLPQTAWIRDSEWVAAPIPADLQDRRVEITGPVDRKMIINALNSGASVFMADFEDSNSPTWRNNLDGQFNLRDAVNGTIELHKSRRKALPVRRAHRRPDGAAARLASGRKALSGGWQADLRRPLRFRALLFSQCQSSDREGHRAVFLSA